MRRRLLLSLGAALLGYALGAAAFSRVGAQVDRAISQILSDG